MKAVIHIGAHKTGTTTIQCFLKENREALQKRGVFVPSSAYGWGSWHQELKMTAFDPDMCQSSPYFSTMGYRLYFTPNQQPIQSKNIHSEKKPDLQEEQEKIWKGYQNEIEKNCSKDDRVIFSDEDLSFFSEKEVRKVKELMDSLFDEVTIVLYLRRQPEYLVSFYNTWIHVGSPWNIFEFLNVPEERSVLAFHKNVQNWSVFGKDKVKIRVFDKQELHENDLLSDFALTAGFDITGLVRPKDANISLGSAETEFLRLLNTHIPIMLDPWTYNHDRFIIYNTFFRKDWRRKEKPYYLNRSEARRILEQYKDGNDWIAREYLGREKLFHDDLSMYPEEVTVRHHLTPERGVEISAELLKAHQAEIQRQQAEVQRQQDEVQRQQDEVQCQQAEIQRLQAEIQRQQTEIQHQRSKIQSQEDEIQRLQDEIQRLLHRRNKRLLYRCKALLTWAKEEVTKTTKDRHR